MSQITHFFKRIPSTSGAGDTGQDASRKSSVAADAKAVGGPSKRALSATPSSQKEYRQSQDPQVQPPSTKKQKTSETTRQATCHSPDIDLTKMDDVDNVQADAQVDQPHQGGQTPQGKKSAGKSHKGNDAAGKTGQQNDAELKTPQKKDSAGERPASQCSNPQKKTKQQVLATKFCVSGQGADSSCQAVVTAPGEGASLRGTDTTHGEEAATQADREHDQAGNASRKPACISKSAATPSAAKPGPTLSAAQPTAQPGPATSAAEPTATPPTALFAGTPSTAQPTPSYMGAVGKEACIAAMLKDAEAAKLLLNCSMLLPLDRSSKKQSISDTIKIAKFIEGQRRCQGQRHSQDWVIQQVMSDTGEADNGRVQSLVMQLAVRKSYASKDPDCDMLSAGSNTNKDNMWFWEVRDPKKMLSKVVEETLRAAGGQVPPSTLSEAPSLGTATNGGDGGGHAFIQYSPVVTQVIEREKKKEADRAAREAAKEAERVSKENEKAGKEAAKEAERLAKENEKAAKEAAKEAEKSSKEAAREAERAAKEAEKAAKEAEKKLEKEEKSAKKKVQKSGFASKEQLERSKATMLNFLKSPPTAAANKGSTPSKALFRASPQTSPGCSLALSQGQGAAERPNPSEACTTISKEAMDASLVAVSPSTLQKEFRDMKPRWQKQRSQEVPLKGVPPTWARKAGCCLDFKELAARYYGDGVEMSTLRTWRRKLISHHTSVRPAYYGSFTRTSASVRPCRPYSRDPLLDYEVESDQDWEEEPEGEDLNAMMKACASVRWTKKGGQRMVNEGGAGDGDVEMEVKTNGAKGDVELESKPNGARGRLMDQRMVVLDGAIDRARRANKPLLLSSIPGAICRPHSTLDPELLQVLRACPLREKVEVHVPSDLSLLLPDIGVPQGTITGHTSGTPTLVNPSNKQSGGSGRPRMDVPNDLMPSLVHLLTTSKAKIDQIVEAFVAQHPDVALAKSRLKIRIKEIAAWDPRQGRWVVDQAALSRFSAEANANATPTATPPKFKHTPSKGPLHATSAAAAGTQPHSHLTTLDKFLVVKPSPSNTAMPATAETAGVPASSATEASAGISSKAEALKPTHEVGTLGTQHGIAVPPSDTHATASAIAVSAPAARCTFPLLAPTTTRPTSAHSRVSLATTSPAASLPPLAPTTSPAAALPTGLQCTTPAAAASHRDVSAGSAQRNLLVSNSNTNQQYMLLGKGEVNLVTPPDDCTTLNTPAGQPHSSSLGVAPSGRPGPPRAMTPILLDLRAAMAPLGVHTDTHGTNAPNGTPASQKCVQQRTPATQPPRASPMEE
eukprot:gene25584-11237_t